MANNIKRKDLYQRLCNLKQNDWIKAAEMLDLRVCLGSKHPVIIRDPNKPNDLGKTSLIAVIPNNLHKIMNEAIIKEFLKFGIKEDDIWKALGLLK